MAAVVAHGSPLVDDPDRVGEVTQLGVDETSFLKANRHHPTVYATGLVDTERGVLIDMVKGNSASDLRKWCADQPTGCRLLRHETGPPPARRGRDEGTDRTGTSQSGR